jgi:hypothetical protein
MHILHPGAMGCVRILFLDIKVFCYLTNNSHKFILLRKDNTMLDHTAKSMKLSRIVSKNNLGTFEIQEKIMVQNLIYLQNPIGGLAQLARAFAWHAKGHRFDSGNLHLNHYQNTANACKSLISRRFYFREYTQSFMALTAGLQSR